jgi:hypothetical protein
MIGDVAQNTARVADWACCVPGGVRASIPMLGFVAHSAQTEFMDACLLHDQQAEVISHCALITWLSSLCSPRRAAVTLLSVGSSCTRGSGSQTAEVC